MDETSSGYSSRGEGHLYEGPKEPRIAPSAKDTKENAATVIRDTTTEARGGRTHNDSTKLLDSNGLSSDEVLLKQESHSKLRRERAVSPCSSIADGQLSQSGYQPNDGANLQLSLQKIRTDKELDVREIHGNDLRKINFDYYLNKYDKTTLVEALLDDNMALQRQLISSQEFFYRIIDDLKARLVEADSYTRMVSEQLKQQKVKVNACTCHSEVASTKAISQDYKLLRARSLSNGISSADNVGQKGPIVPTNTASLQSRPSDTPKSDSPRSKDSSLSSQSGSGSIRTKEELRERNKQLRQQISVLKETYSESISDASSREKEHTVMPNIVSSSHFTAATRPKSNRYRSAKTKKDHIAVEEVRWIKKPPLSPRKQSAHSSAVAGQNGAFRTINVQSWAADSSQR